ncbi:MAG TPA: phosphate regulon transcriptional regulator PhoB [Alphaproteobacteria bacterium]|nr:two-component system, OmpR family, phosphate regulon response regulator PhoB [Alphaproteobacteria bacterium]HEX4889560.1 phosphate regulon transcriptional regulator PhoB [Alphaproteobacteria bacterium]
MKPLILIAEDEPAQMELLRYNMESADFRTILASDGASALALVDEEKPDLLVLDWMLPEMSGIEVCRRVRARPETRALPVIMLTARGEESDRVRGLETGADDYLVKPFSQAELVARIRALLRRSRPALTDEQLAYGGIVMDIASHRVSRDNVPVQLGPTEFRMLRFLLERPGRVYSREQLLDQVWGRDVYVESRTVDVHIRRLRMALDIEGAPDIIRTVRGAGYALDVSAN